MTAMPTDTGREEGLELWPLIESYCADVDRELAARVEAWPPDFAQIHVHEVLGGLLAREATLAKDIARAPTLWTGHSAPILLRAMADVYINIEHCLAAARASRTLRQVHSFRIGAGQART